LICGTEKSGAKIVHIFSGVRRWGRGEKVTCEFKEVTIELWEK